MTVLLFILLLVAIAFLMERFQKMYSLRKVIQQKEKELLAYKNMKEEFARSLSQSQTEPQNILMDPLSHLLNKEAFDSQFTHLLNQSKRFNSLFALLVLDINKFKRINEKYTQAVGDKVLAEMGSRLKHTLRDVDILSRHEGDIFFVLLPNMIKPEVIVHAVERIIHAISLPYEIDGNVIEVTAGVGIAIYPFDGEDKHTLIVHANEALKKAKSSSGNVFQFYQEETQILGQRELDLKSAIKSKDFLDNVILEYKPYNDSLKDQIDCVEVLASLKHPQLGKIPFSELARVSHYSSRMFELYDWIMKNAVLECAKADNEILHKCPLIFKFELKQLEKPHFADQIIEIVRKNAINGNKIVLELVDDIDNANLEVFRDPITKLNDSHVPVAIGVLVLGHFALNKLNHVHFDYLKIDEKLVHDLAKRAESQEILKRILSLVDNLKIATLTAGVDTEEQKKLLEAMGCTVMQGKFFKPLSLD